MEKNQIPLFRVSDFLAVVNQSLDISIGIIEIEGEVASFKRSQQKYIFFDLKDRYGIVNCFMMEWQLRIALEDGMKVIVRGSPRLTDKGKFSFTVQAVRLVGEGSIKKSFELVKSKLQAEGLFNEDRKRSLPEIPEYVAVISSIQSAGYADFVKIINDRWSGLKVDVAHVQVQGESAPDQIIEALRYFNSSELLPEVIVIVRGGGSMDDLAVFNDEKLVREIAASRIPILIGVGHEVDETLADMVADIRAATPSNAAQILVPDKRQVLNNLDLRLNELSRTMSRVIEDLNMSLRETLHRGIDLINKKLLLHENELDIHDRVLRSLDPNLVLKKGYALVRGRLDIGQVIEVETSQKIVKAKVEECYEK